MSDKISKIISSAQGGDSVALAKLLTWLEREGAVRAFEHKAILEPENMALRIGITGPPGAGKSTLVGQLLGHLSAKKLKVGVLAVDPSSPFSQGAILGDRIRYMEYSSDPNIFIRSLGTRGSLGGLSSSAYLMLRAFDACEFDVVLIETVGVGQSELDVMYVADDISVVLVPEAGDSVQAMKAGLLEIADLFVVNKSDKPGAASLVRELQFVAETASMAGKTPEVIETVGTTGAGVEKWAARIFTKLKNGDFKKGRSDARRIQAEARALGRGTLEQKVEKSVLKVKNPDGLWRFLKGL